jgi:preprotein translocase SecE subunit
MAFIQYLKDTRGELNHVAWPTRVQTIVFTILVIAISIFVALYLGFLDYVLTTGLGKAVELTPGASVPTPTVDVVTEPVASSTIDIDSIVPTDNQ